MDTTTDELGMDDIKSIENKFRVGRVVSPRDLFVYIKLRLDKIERKIDSQDEKTLVRIKRVEKDAMASTPPHGVQIWKDATSTTPVPQIHQTWYTEINKAFDHIATQLVLLEKQQQPPSDLFIHLITQALNELIDIIEKELTQ